jgi:hypothetical protein
MTRRLWNDAQVARERADVLTAQTVDRSNEQTPLRVLSSADLMGRSCLK